MRRRIGVALLCAASASCTSLNSSSVTTSGMSAHMTITGDGSGQTSVTASLNVDNNSTDYVNLTSGDTLIASVPGQSHTMTENNVLGVVSYNASFSNADASGTLYTVALRRSSGTSAPSSVCMMPMPFAITTPAPGASYSRANDAIAVTYSGSGQMDPMSLSISGCVSYTLPFTDSGSGSVTIAKGGLQGGASPSTGSCEVTLTITRSRAGTLDPAFGYGGAITCQQVRSVTFTSAP
jgi:hypothetical protein